VLRCAHDRPSRSPTTRPNAIFDQPRPNSRSPAATAAPPAPPPGYAYAATSPPHANTASTS
jgi:hypothetical protein